MSELVLRSSPLSPFGRKVKIAAALCGIADRIEVVMTDTMDPADSLREQNPLGKIPTLILGDGTTIYDSRVIVEFFDHIAGGGRVIPRDPELRLYAMRNQALADGIMDAAVLRRYEVAMRAESERSAKWDAHQAGKVHRGLDWFEEHTPTLETIAIGEIALACALGYLDLRFPGTWRNHHPRLVGFLDGFAAAVPAFAATKPQ